MKKLKTFDSDYFRGKSHFEDDGTQNWLVFQPIHRYFKTASNNPSIILSRKSKGLSDESIKTPTTSNKCPNPSLYFVGTKASVRFSGDCLTLSRRRPILYRNHSIDLLCKSMNWFLYDIGLRRERAKTGKNYIQSRENRKHLHCL